MKKNIISNRKNVTVCLVFGLILSSAFILPAAAREIDDADLPTPSHISILEGQANSSPVVLAARRYAAFWNTGEEKYAKAALSGAFVDRTLPPGRPQGVAGPLKASATFRAAVPDLRVEIEDMIVSGDRVSLHLRFRGHFTGQFSSTKGQGQPIDFQAFDLYRVTNEKILENWHLEDNLTLLQQMGIVAK